MGRTLRSLMDVMQDADSHNAMYVVASTMSATVAVTGGLMVYRLYERQLQSATEADEADDGDEANDADEGNEADEADQDDECDEAETADAKW